MKRYVKAQVRILHLSAEKNLLARSLTEGGISFDIGEWETDPEDYGGPLGL